MGHAHAIDAAHVTGGAGRHEHIARGEGLGGSVEVQQIFLRLEHDAVLGLLINLDLRVVWAHVALAAGAGQSRQAHRSRMP